MCLPSRSLVRLSKCMVAFINIQNHSMSVLQRPRTEWVLNWPGQLVIAGCQTYWTAEVSDALEKGDLNSFIPNLLAQVGNVISLDNYWKNLLSICHATVLHFTLFLPYCLPQ
jgi:hypothetical protein